jgi:hypothetical protein
MCRVKNPAFKDVCRHCGNKYHTLETETSSGTQLSNFCAPPPRIEPGTARARSESVDHSATGEEQGVTSRNLYINVTASSAVKRSKAVRFLLCAKRKRKKTIILDLFLGLRKKVFFGPAVCPASPTRASSCRSMLPPLHRDSNPGRNTHKRVR